ncbi:hypothetical protein [Mycobacterium paraintracellulare]|uniref:hypothetical protein n=1 Tax=Mycobacterium paraintracellulare TaxID=1138383 RepID=UPI001928CE94|nr:hypothetical protein [Mycobacterium paraintracellulare]
MQQHDDATDRQSTASPDTPEPSRPEEDSLPADTEQENNTQHGTEADVDGDAERPRRKRLSGLGLATALSAAVIAALGSLVGWWGYRTYEMRQAQAQRNLFVAVARQGALDLTSIDYSKVDADVQRILDSSVGTFHDDFQKRSQPFTDVVKKAQSKSEGTITGAGLESQDGDQAQVLVAVSVKTSTAGAPEQDPRRWRMRIVVQKVGNGAKVSDVRFVP